MNPKTPYPEGSWAEAAYLVGLEAQMPPPQIVMNDALLSAWDAGMDERERRLALRSADDA